jgi:hypothetical protein
MRIQALTKIIRADASKPPNNPFQLNDDDPDSKILETPSTELTIPVI